ncbi:aldose 1-epimerase [Bryobacter aggregatus]|uniref:aldose 1-epimerase n=1 Tax=Bryobacter aggregatus TaxID=360054 RepID=UPI00138E09BF|nr:aldose 1-epimerase [Bryobacter aggregatus]
MVRLTEVESGSEVAVSPAFGANSYDYHVNGKRVFWTTPNASLGELIAKQRMGGNPLLSPWANRIEGLSYEANGKKYHLNPDLGNLRLDQNKNPIHGLVTFTKLWQVREVSAQKDHALVRLSLDCSKQPDWLAQFPFPHRLEITYKLVANSLEVITSVENLATEPMPLAIGYHPYFQLSDAPRDEWQVTIPAKDLLVLSPKLIPTGERKPNPYAAGMKLAGVVLDDVFGGLEERATFRVKGKTQTIDVVYGKDYTIGVVYAPAGQGFICFEPMTAPTNAFNTPGAAKTIAPGMTWRESYWIQTSGF